jgi:competence protein ComFC
VGFTYLQRNKYNSMSIIESIVSIFAPHTCVGCQAEGDSLLCEACAQQLSLAPSRCYRCGTATHDYAVCAACTIHSGLDRVTARAPYEGLARELIHATKYERAQAGTAVMARQMARMLQHDPDSVYVAIPTATSRVRTRGYDHTALLVREIARLQGGVHQRLLARMGQAHQMGADRGHRLVQLEGAFRVTSPEAVRGRTIVLVDDVLTTGTTLETAAQVLRDHGALRVSATVFAQA